MIGKKSKCHFGQTLPRDRRGSMTYFHDRRVSWSRARIWTERKGKAEEKFTGKGWSIPLYKFAVRLPSFSVWSHTCRERRCAAPRYNEPGKPVAFARARAYEQIDSFPPCVLVCYIMRNRALHFPSSELSRCRCGLFANINRSCLLLLFPSLASSFLLHLSLSPILKSYWIDRRIIIITHTRVIIER